MVQQYISVKRVTQQALRMFERSMASLDNYRQKIMQVSFSEDTTEGEASAYETKKKELVLAILNTQMSVEFKKFHHLDDMLKGLGCYGDEERAPDGCSIDNYQLFLDTDPVVFQLQTEILELKARLITLKKEQLVRLSYADIHNAYRQNALSKLLSILNSLRPTGDCDVYVTTLMENRRSFLHQVVTQYVQAFKARCERGDRADSPEFMSTTSGLGPSLQNISLVGFLEAVAEHIYHEGMANQMHLPAPDVLQQQLETHIMPQIYEDAWNCVLQSGRDRAAEKQCERLAHLSQGDIIKNRAIHVTGPIPFLGAISQLRMLHYSVTATAKINTILATAKSICTTIEGAHPGKAVGGDDFLDVWVYVTIHANVRGISTCLAFIEAYANPMVLQGETEYCFTVLKLAVDYIRKLNPVTLTTDDRYALPKPSKYQYVVSGLRPELIRWDRATDRPDGPFSRIRVLRSRYLFEYQSILVKEWAVSPSRPVISVLHRTGNPQHKCLVHVCEVELSPLLPTATSAERLEVLCALLMVPNCSYAISPIRTHAHTHTHTQPPAPAGTQTDPTRARRGKDTQATQPREGKVRKEDRREKKHKTKTGKDKEMEKRSKRERHRDKDKDAREDKGTGTRKGSGTTPADGTGEQSTRTRTRGAGGEERVEHGRAMQRPAGGVSHARVRGSVGRMGTANGMRESPAGTTDTGTGRGQMGPLKNVVETRPQDNATDMSHAQDHPGSECGDIDRSQMGRRDGPNGDQSKHGYACGDMPGYLPVIVSGEKTDTDTETTHGSEPIRAISTDQLTPCGLHVTECVDGPFLCLAALGDVLIDPTNNGELNILLPPVEDAWVWLPVLWRNFNLQRLGCEVGRYTYIWTCSWRIS